MRIAANAPLRSLRAAAGIFPRSGLFEAEKEIAEIDRMGLHRREDPFRVTRKHRLDDRSVGQGRMVLIEVLAGELYDRENRYVLLDAGSGVV